MSNFPRLRVDHLPEVVESGCICGCSQAGDDAVGGSNVGGLQRVQLHDLHQWADANGRKPADQLHNDQHKQRFEHILREIGLIACCVVIKLYRYYPSKRKLGFFVKISI